MNHKFNALEYNKDDTFSECSYTFDGNENEGWKIYRNGELYLNLSHGYKLLKTLACGVCSTDIDRRFLPFPLPQIIGHELIARDLNTNKKYAVEINDTYLARGSQYLDEFCNTGIPTHSPERMVLGIDRLPGGFGPYILAPKNAMIDIDGLDENISVLTEPFAASLQAIIPFPPNNNTEVAVLGPRRLGSLIIGALSIYRKSSGKNFKIYALARHDHLLSLSLKLGADEAIDLRKGDEKIKNRFDIVYDTTANPDGFEKALEYSNRVVHLKSTNGQTVTGIRKMTELVVDEISILPYNTQNLDFHWDGEFYNNQEIYISPTLKEKFSSLPDRNLYFPNNEFEIKDLLNSNPFKNRLPRFDLAIVSTLEEIDFVLRPFKNSEESLLRPRGAILFDGEPKNNPFLNFLASGKILNSSRCGDFHLAIKLLKENKELANNISKNMISHTYHNNDIEKAFQKAKERDSIKVVIKFNE